MVSIFDYPRIFLFEEFITGPDHFHNGSLYPAKTSKNSLAISQKDKPFIVPNPKNPKSQPLRNHSASPDIRIHINMKWKIQLKSVSYETMAIFGLACEIFKQGVLGEGVGELSNWGREQAIYFCIATPLKHSRYIVIINIQYKNMIRNLLILVALVIAAQAACSGSNELEGLASGFATFALPASGSAPSATYSHRFDNALLAIPAVAFGIWDSAVAASALVPFGDFSLTTKPSVSGVDFELKASSRAWRSLRVGFWANTRPDFYLGTYSANLGSLKGNSSTQTVQVGPISNYQKSIARVFLNGFGLNSDSRSLQLQVEPRAVQENSIQVLITAGPESSLKSLQFSYLVFSPSMASFASYGGMVSRTGFSGSGYQDIANSIYSPNAVLQGLVRINSPLSFSLSTSLDSDFIFGFKQQGNNVDFVFSYVVAGVAPRSVCSQCEEKYAFGSECVASCPAGSYAFTYKDGGMACRKCSAKLNMVVNANANGCTCASGFQLANGVCVAVPTNSMSTSGDFASGGMGQAGSSITSISQSGSQVSTISTGSVITLPGAIAPTITTNINMNPTVNAPSGGITIIPSKPVDPNANSYVPSVPNENYPAQPTTPIPPTNNTATNAVTAQSCANFLNTYWTGYRCSCRVGYKVEAGSGQCIRITLVPVTPPYVPPVDNCRENEVWAYNQCVCRDGFTRDPQNRCIPNIVCPENSFMQQGVCVCREGFTRRNDVCVPSTCPANSYHNGVTCVCNPNFVFDSAGVCQPGSQCPPNSVRVGGVCQCVQGFREVSPGVCSQCEQGAIFIGGQCVVTCGVNEQFNNSTRKCQCKPGFGLHQGVCSTCPANFFLFNGYCVTCPLYATYNAQTNRCDCPGGAQVVAGQCTSTSCPANQVYNSTLRTCRCVAGLGLLDNNQCGTCPAGTNPDATSQRCTSSCLTGQVLQNGRCVCQQGLGVTLAGSCARCDTIPNAVLMGGYCVTCPNRKVWVAGVCACPSGTTEVSGVCQRTCGPNQLADANNVCYYCPVNEIISNNMCVCAQNYIRDATTRVCKISCPAGQVVINNMCGTCALNTQYFEQLRACLCPTGSYTNLQGYCEPRVTPPIQCTGAFYRSGNLCVPCDASCATCSGPGSCLTCVNPSAQVTNGQCVVARCGNGIVEGGEGCDDANTIGGDGCSATCAVEPNYRCFGNPSICQSTVVNNCGNGLPDAGEACDDRNRVNGDGCSSTCQVEQGYTCTAATQQRPSFCARQPTPPGPNDGMTLREVVINRNNVFVTLVMPVVFAFASQQEMTSFIQYQIPAGYEPSSGYCRQRTTDLKMFDCLFNYPTGVKSTTYQIQFSYNRDGANGYLVVPIDYARSQTMSRSLK